VFIPKDFVWLAQHLSNLVVGERTVRTGLGAHAAEEPINGFNTLTFLCCTVQYRSSLVVRNALRPSN
jgi:hypothetical protein